MRSDDSGLDHGRHRSRGRRDAARAVAAPLFVALIMASAAAADTPSDGRAWTALTPAQQSALAPLRPQWGTMSAEQQRKWLQLADRTPSMGDDERARVQERMAQWARLTPEERAVARQRFLEARQLSPDGRDRQWQAYQALPSDARLELQQRAADAVQRPRPAARPLDASKRNVVDPPAPASLRSVAPAVVQVRPGVSTSPITRPRTPPLHHQAGLPKIAATGGFVDPATLLPRRGPQAAASPGVPAARTPATTP